MVTVIAVCRYASSQELKVVCSALVIEYPCLQDKIRVGQNSLRYVCMLLFGFYDST